MTTPPSHDKMAAMMEGLYDMWAAYWGLLLNTGPTLTVEKIIVLDRALATGWSPFLDEPMPFNGEPITDRERAHAEAAMLYRMDKSETLYAAGNA